MVRYIRDTTGRFERRPYWQERELDEECERIVFDFLQRHRRKVEFPISTEDLKTLIEEEVQDLDQYADLSEYGQDVEGLTEFEPGRKPTVRIAAQLAEADNRENRFRTTLTHEYGHAKFHACLFNAEPRTADLFSPEVRRSEVVSCKREGIVDAPKADWMEWQAGYICGSILMPVRATRQLVGNIQENLQLFGAVPTGSQAGNAMIRALAETFQVSFDAARVRLTRLGAIGTQLTPQSLFAAR